MQPLPKLKRYQKDFEYSYALGTFATKELLLHRPHDVIEVILSSDVKQQSLVEELKGLCTQHSIHFEVNDSVIDRLSVKENCYAIGVFRKYETDLQPGTNHLVLYHPSDMGNLGTIIRTMIGLSFHNLVIIKPAADIFDPKVVRATMGALFQMNFVHFDTLEDYFHTYPRNYFIFDIKGATDLPKVKFTEPFSLIFGNEAAGIPDEFLTRGKVVKIPQSGAIDSLNLGISVGIGLYEASKS